MRDRRLVGHDRDRLQIDPARQQVLGQGAAVSHFLPAEPDGHEGGVVKPQKTLGGQGPSGGIQARDDRGGGLGRDLLGHDDV